MNSQSVETNSPAGPPLPDARPLPSAWALPSAWKAQWGLALVMILAFPLVAAWGWRMLGSIGVAYAAISGAICWVAGMVAIAIVARSRRAQHNPGNVISGVLLGTLVRLAVPLVALLVSAALLDRQGSRHFGGMVMANYLLGLVVETVLLTKLIHVAPSVAKVS